MLRFVINNANDTKDLLVADDFHPDVFGCVTEGADTKLRPFFNGNGDVNFPKVAGNDGSVVGYNHTTGQFVPVAGGVQTLTDGCRIQNTGTATDPVLKFQGLTSPNSVLVGSADECMSEVPVGPCGFLHRDGTGNLVGTAPSLCASEDLGNVTQNWVFGTNTLRTDTITNNTDCTRIYQVHSRFFFEYSTTVINAIADFTAILFNTNINVPSCGLGRARLDYDVSTVTIQGEHQWQPNGLINFELAPTQSATLTTTLQVTGNANGQIVPRRYGALLCHLNWRK